jgi:alkylated DNA repair dioxygenase AlkB
MTLHKMNDLFDVLEHVDGGRASLVRSDPARFCAGRGAGHHRRIAACGDGLAVSAYDDARRPLMLAGVTNCGAAGWVSRLRGYRYHPRDPLSGAPWPTMPTVFTELATEASDWAGYDGFAPDACLIPSL